MTEATVTRASALAELASTLMRNHLLLEYEPGSHVVSAVQIGPGFSIACERAPEIEFVGQVANVASDRDLAGWRYGP